MLSVPHIRGACLAYALAIVSTVIPEVGGAPASAAELAFAPAAFVPGDAGIGPAAGMQEDAQIAAGGAGFLAVWSDYRSTPDDYPPFQSEGSGADIYGALLDADGNTVGSLPFVIDQGVGDQLEPKVAWNGTNWLVTWKQATIDLPTYELILAVRVAPDGTVLDDSPIVVHNDDSYYEGTALAGGDGEWLALFNANGPVLGLVGVRIGGDGVVANPGGLVVHATNFLIDFDAAFAGDEYLVVWSGVFDAPRGRRYTPDLQPLGTSVLPFAQKVESDGQDFLVVQASGPPPLATIDAVRVLHGGAVLSPVTLFTGGNQDGTCCADVTWDGTHYWVAWGGPRLARVTQDGQVLDPGGFVVQPSEAPTSAPAFAAAAGGGLQLAFHDGVNGADYPKDVHTARVEPDTQFGEESVLSLGAPCQREPDFAKGDGTNLLVYWSRVSGSGRILAQRIDDGGSPLDLEPIEVASGPIPGIGVPTLGEPGAAWNGSVFLVTWSDGVQIYARRMLPDGSFVDSEPLTVMDGFDPDVAAVGPNFLIAGLDFLQDNPQWQATHVMRVDGVTGMNLDPEPNALGGFVIFARNPRVEAWGDRWLVVWQTNISHDEPGASTKAALVEADGTTSGVIQVPLGWRPQVAVSDDAALFVAVTNTIASATTDLAGAIMTPEGTFPGGSFLISTAPDKQLRPAATWNGSEFVVAWEDKRDAVVYFDERTDIYAARVTVDGIVLDPAGVPVAGAFEPEQQPSLVAIDGQVLLAVSTFLPGSDRAAFRIGIHPALTPASVDDLSQDGEGLRLLGVFPNPSVGTTSIRFEAPAQKAADVRIFDPSGRLVRLLDVDAGTTADARVFEVRWDGRDDTGASTGAGVYFYEVRAGDSALTGRLVRLR